MTLVTQWLLTYLLHSTVLLGASALLRIALRERRLGLQEAVLRAAFVGGFVTASLQIGLGVEPLGGVVRVSGIEAAPARTVGSLTLGDVIAGSLPGALDAMQRSSEVTAAPSLWPTWPAALFLAWAVTALIGFGRLGTGAARLRRLLHARAPLAAPELEARAAAVAEGLGLRRPVPLRTAPRLTVPLATGVLRPEVLLPTRALDELGMESQLALCAHELAHVARRDPAWILLARILEAAVPLQPLNTWARRRLQDLAECLSDDLAVCAAGRARGLARSLVDVASWTVGEPALPPAVAAGALSARSRLGHRVERLMDPLRTPERPRRLLLPLAAAAVAATALVTPVVSGDAAEETAGRTATTRRAEETRRELERLTARIAARAESRTAEVAELRAQIEAEAGKGLPPPEEMRRLEGELEGAARAMADAQAAHRAGGARSGTATRKEIDTARQRMAEARDALQEAVRSARLSAEAQRKLHEAARITAESVRPTAEELEDMRRLSRELAGELRPDLQELGSEMRRLSGELRRDGLVELRRAIDELMRRRDHLVELRGAMDELRRTMEQTRDSMHEAIESARESAREGAEEARRELSSALDEAPPQPPEAPPAPAAPEAPPEPPLPPEPPDED